ncbi:MAG TPA: hypothetical protein VFU31_30515 [Candidatus Binatia bacterium]|nr:hypothetical protein [Candidatus Binatia bacterium]
MDVIAGENYYCDRCYRIMAKHVRSQTIEFSKNTLFGRALAKAIETSGKTIEIEVLPEPKAVSPNIDIYVCHAIISLSHLQQRHRLTKVQTAIAAQAICRVMSYVAEQAQLEATQQN